MIILGFSERPDILTRTLTTHRLGSESLSVKRSNQPEMSLKRLGTNKWGQDSETRKAKKVDCPI